MTVESRHTARQMLNKVPEITLYFWVIKVLCTTVGETASDYLAGNLEPRPDEDDVHHRRALSSPCCRPVQAQALRRRRLLARDRADQRRRHPDHRQPDRQPRRLARHDHDRLQHRARDRVRRLVRERAHAVDPHDLHDAPRGVLLARRALHVRARHRRRRPDRRAPQRRLRLVAACSSPARSRSSPRCTTASG